MSSTATDFIVEICVKYEEVLLSLVCFLLSMTDSLFPKLSLMCTTKISSEKPGVAFFNLE